MDFFFLGIEESLGLENKFVKLNKLLDFNKFRELLKGIHLQDMSNRGRPSYGSLMMFKLLLLGQLHSLSDRELANSLSVRLDFLYFTGFVPTAAFLKQQNIKNRILTKAKRNKPLTKRQKLRNILISKVRYKVERCFGTLKRKFHFDRASYFSTKKVQAQAILKACCFNMLKAVNLMA